jgi:hypothetical protein
MTENERIAEFWGWWRRHSRGIAEAIEARTVRDLAEDIGAQVHRLHPKMEWELAPGGSAKHALVITSGGTPELRPLAERCVRGGPPADEIWEYHPARVPSPSIEDVTLEYGPHTLRVSGTEASIAIDQQRQLLDVSVYHPLFKEMPEGSRNQVTYLFLDWLLGEDGVERWLGGIESVTERPADALPVTAIPETAEALARRNAHKDDEWALLQGQADDGSIVLVTARRPLKWIDHPLLDQHIAVSLEYAERNPVGLPEPEALERLRAAEDELVAAVGPHALLAAVQTVEGTRTLHLYADSQDAVARERAERWVATTAGARIDVTPDPGWRAVRQFA